MMTGPSDIRTIQALQLIAVYSPITVLLDPETSQPLISGSMAFSTALKIARSMGLEYSSAHLSKLGGALYRREPGVEKEAYFWENGRSSGATSIAGIYTFKPWKEDQTLLFSTERTKIHILRKMEREIQLCSHLSSNLRHNLLKKRSKLEVPAVLPTIIGERF